ncbi:hypothetical protein [Micromonospora avicenniae]|uniref:hypothetical protein n=1 Tax=Micromonospora avicenniae TaxID=1198245 RepID=UPI000A011B82|nr:hypothetical protein [Micromonospora avicenniae]
MHDTPPAVPDFTQWPSFPFEGDLRVKQIDDPVPVEPPRKGEGNRECIACGAPDEAYIWVGERWRVRAMDRPTGLPMVLILETRSHLDLGDLPNLLAAELGVMTVRLERAIRSLDDVARVHVNRWGDGSAHLHLWFLARPYGRLQLRGTFLSLWDSILPPIPEAKWRENLALVAAWLADFGGRPLAEPPRIEWQAPSSIASSIPDTDTEAAPETSVIEAAEETPTGEGMAAAEADADGDADRSALDEGPQGEDDGNAEALSAGDVPGSGAAAEHPVVEEATESPTPLAGSEAAGNASDGEAGRQPKVPSPRRPEDDVAAAKPA